MLLGGNVMCGRYVFFTSEEYRELRDIIEEVARRHKSGYGILAEQEIFPSDMAPVLRASAAGREAGLMHWGMPVGQVSRLIINARAETLFEKPLFARADRCLVPAAGFFEWEKTPAGKKKYLIYPADRSVLYMAGVYRRRPLKTGEWADCYAIVTTAADAQMRAIHHRMPVALSPAMASAWLDNKSSPKELKEALSSWEGTWVLEAS
jgi:putative SOS response-associated peptidase YedK